MTPFPTYGAFDVLFDNSGGIPPSMRVESPKRSVLKSPENMDYLVELSQVPYDRSLTVLQSVVAGFPRDIESAEKLLAWLRNRGERSATCRILHNIFSSNFPSSSILKYYWYRFLAIEMATRPMSRIFLVDHVRNFPGTSSLIDIVEDPDEISDAERWDI